MALTILSNGFEVSHRLWKVAYDKLGDLKKSGEYKYMQLKYDADVINIEED